MQVDQLNMLIVEDEALIADLLAMHFKDLGAKTTVARDGHQGVTAIDQQMFDIAIVDIQLPGPSGLILCRQLRKKDPKTWIIMLTARGTESDRVIGLEQGADDYLTKPFSILEVIARIKAHCRRSNLALTALPIEDDKHIILGDLSIDPPSRTVKLQDRIIELTGREFDLLLHFVKHPNIVFNRSQLLDQVWGYGHAGYEHTVNSHINRLRAKIEQDPANPNIIITIWGVGYKLIDTTIS